MNKYQKALKNFWLAINCNAISVDDVMKQDLATLQELVDKETPMKVNKQTNKEKSYLTDVSYVYEDVVLGKCPNCETYLHEENEYGDIIDYCPYCGQHLDWSDIDEQH